LKYDIIKEMEYKVKFKPRAIKDCECLKALRQAKAKEAKAKTTSFDQVEKQLDIK
jgi:hypothetical protein